MKIIDAGIYAGLVCGDLDELLDYDERTGHRRRKVVGQR